MYIDIYQLRVLVMGYSYTVEFYLFGTHLQLRGSAVYICRSHCLHLTLIRLHQCLTI